MSLPRPALLLLLAAALGACASPAPEPLPPLALGSLSLVVDEEGPWEVVDTGPAPPAGVAAAPAPRAPVALPPRQPAPAPPRTAAPERRVTAAPAARGTPRDKPAHLLAKERYLDNPTRIVGERITFYCPRPYLPEVDLVGAEVRETRPGRRMATGSARLTCRELTLEGERIVLRVLDDPAADLQITARGDVDFVTRRRDQVYREEGCPTLLLTNDEVSALR